MTHRASTAKRRRGPRCSHAPAFSAGIWILVGLALLSSLAVAIWGNPRSDHRTMWTFARMHALMYAPVVEEWNRTREPKIEVRVFGDVPLQQRMMAAFMSELPSADLIEAERKSAARAFTGPLSSVGFIDLTDRLAADGLRSEINEPSFSPWTSRDRVFGLPHDVHPVMLGYRADIVEAAGIDVSRIETWDDFITLLAPLQVDANHDGVPDRYLLNMWKNHDDHLEVLLLQAGGGFFDGQGRASVDSDTNSHVLAKLVSWCVGPGRVCGDAPNFVASGNKLKVDGFVLCNIMPDWMGDVFKHEMPQLGGKVKLMPLPAWSKGGRRTSVWGGTMLGIPRTAVRSPQDFEQLWAFAKELYLSPRMARTLYETGGIITPVKSFWADPIFDRPDPYFCGQSPGRMYIGLAPSVPVRTSSAYNNFAKARVLDAFVKLFDEAETSGNVDLATLERKAKVYLAEAQSAVKVQMERNVFLREGDE